MISACMGIGAVGGLWLADSQQAARTAADEKRERREKKKEEIRDLKTQFHKLELVNIRHGWT